MECDNKWFFNWHIFVDIWSFVNFFNLLNATLCLTNFLKYKSFPSKKKVKKKVRKKHFETKSPTFLGSGWFGFKTCPHFFN